MNLIGGPATTLPGRPLQISSINKYGVRGNVYEVYVVQQLVTEHLFIRIGYMYVDRKWNGVYLGPAMRVNQQIQNAYAVLDCSW